MADHTDNKDSACTGLPVSLSFIIRIWRLTEVEEKHTGCPGLAAFTQAEDKPTGLPAASVSANILKLAGIQPPAYKLRTRIW